MWRNGTNQYPGCTKWLDGEAGGLRIAAGASLQGAARACCAWVNRPDATTYSQGWAFGTGPSSVKPPEFIIERGVSHTIRIAGRGLTMSPAFFPIQAGNWGSARTLRKWFNRGSLGMISMAVPGIALLFEKIALRLYCPLIICSFPDGFSQQINPRGGRL